MEKTAIVVASCWKYRSFWKPFFYFFNKCWQDCTYKKYLVTDWLNENVVIDGVKIIRGANQSWGTNMKNCLKQIDEQTIILFLEDFFLVNKINSSLIDDYVNHLIDKKIACIRLFPFPGPDSPYSERKDLGIISPGQDWRLSLQTAIWDKNIFNNLLRDGDSTYSVEVPGTKRTNTIPQLFLSVVCSEKVNTPPFTEGVMKENMFAYIMGSRDKWTAEAIQYCQENKLDIDFVIHRG